MGRSLSSSIYKTQPAKESANTWVPSVSNYPAAVYDKEKEYSFSWLNFLCTFNKITKGQDLHDPNMPMSHFRSWIIRCGKSDALADVRYSVL